MDTYTITEDCSLPSKGKVYNKVVNPEFKIRSMTTEEEMKRLGHSEKPNKLLSEILDGCLLDKPGISSYDMCTGDYQYLLHRLRVATFGPEYKIETVCPICGNVNKTTINLDDEKILEYNEDLQKYLSITLPRTKKEVKLRMQTPRILDDIIVRAKEHKQKHPDMEGDSAFLFTLEAIIVSVDGEIYDQVKLDRFVRNLPMMDTNYILQCAKKLDESIGIDTNIPCDCNNCNAHYTRVFPITGEFFGPSVD